MYKKTLIILLSLCLLTACSQRSANSNTTANQKVSDDSTTTTENQEINEDSIELVVTNTSSAYISLPSMSSLGDVTFTVDTDKAVTDIVPIGKERSITVIDSSGTEWTLTIPANAVPAGTKITITPLVKIESASYPCAITGGVMLEPSGLTFDKNGTLSVKMPKDVPSVMLTGDEEGKDLYFVDSKQADGTVTASIAHFSTAYFQPTDDPNMKSFQDSAQRDYETTLENVKELLKQPIEVIPPPTITLECYKDDKLAQARTYAEQVLLPELSYLEMLFNHGKTMALLGSETAEKESFEYAERILNRLVRKAKSILAESKKDPNKYLPTALAVIGIYKLAANFGVEVPSPSEAIGPYTEKTATYCLKEIRDNHNFKYIRGALEIGRMSALLGNESNLEELLNALTFKTEFELNFTQDVYYEDMTLNAKWVITGEGETKAGVQATSIFTGEGAGEYAPIVSNHEGMSVDSFAFTVFVTNFDPCESGTAEFQFDRLMADVETYWSLEMPSAQAQDPLIRKFAEHMFPLQNGMFVFTMPINNGQAEVCNFTVSSSIENEDIKMPMNINIKFTHTPK